MTLKYFFEEFPENLIKWHMLCSGDRKLVIQTLIFIFNNEIQKNIIKVFQTLFRNIY